MPPESSIPTPTTPATTLSTGTSQVSWRQEPWVWLIIALPMASVLFGTFMVYFAITHGDSLVRDHYYKDGLAINQQLKGKEQAAKWQLDANITVTQGYIQLKFKQPLPKKHHLITFRIIHPTLDKADQEIILNPTTYDSFGGKLKVPLIDGRYYLQLESFEHQWHMKTTTFITNTQFESRFKASAE